MGANHLYVRDRKLILVVEDSPVQALSLTHLLEKEEVDVLCAPNGRSGVLLAERYHPDVIILDVQMPEMNGLDACKLLKQKVYTSDIPIVMLTAHSQPEVLMEGLGYGAIDFIPKDAFSEAVLVETLRQLNILKPARGE